MSRLLRRKNGPFKSSFLVFGFNVVELPQNVSVGRRVPKWIRERLKGQFAANYPRKERSQK